MRQKRKSTPPPGPARIEKQYLLLASFVIGAVILVVEIVGTRVISPYYGASIYVWSSLIGVTLASLAVGYWSGGYVADRWPRVTAFTTEVIGGALFLLLIPLFRRSVLIWSTPLGLKAGSLLSAAVLFGPPLVLLSMTGPLAIRLVTNEFTVLGRAVGWIYGVSTLGSMVGAIITGFVLIPMFSVRSLLVGLALVLLVLGGSGLLLVRRPLAAGGVCALALVAGALLGFSAARPSNVVYLGNSFYGELKVVDVGNLRLFLINGVDNGLVDRRTFRSVAPYMAYFAYLPAARPQAMRALFIGLGSGSAPRIFHLEHRIATEVVEIDPAILHAARRYFDFPADVPVFIEDGRQYVERTANRYDLVVLDAFNTETHPEHLFTREFFASVERVLAPDGVFAINAVGMPYGAPAAWRSVYATLKERFALIRVFLGADLTPRDTTSYTNMFFVASHGAVPSPGSLRGRDAGEAETFDRMARREIVVRPEFGGEVVLTDDYNPLDDLQRRLFVLWRQDFIRTAEGVLLFDGSD